MRYVLCRLFFYFEMLICLWVLVAVLHLPATHFYKIKKTVETRTGARHLHSYTVLNKLIGSKIQNLEEKPHKKVKIFWDTLDEAMLITNMLPLLGKMSHHLYWECEVSLL